MGKRVRVHEFEKGWSRIGAKDMNFVASALIEPGLVQASEGQMQEDAFFATDEERKKKRQRTLIQLQTVGKKEGALTTAIVWSVSG